MSWVPGPTPLTDHTNVAIIDGQHQQCAESLQRLAQALREDADAAAISQLFVRLSDLVEVHFTAEESLMRSYAYLLRTGHAADHDRGRALIQGLARHLYTGNDAAVRLIEELDQWLNAHIHGWDTRLGTHLNSIGIE